MYVWLCLVLLILYHYTIAILLKNLLHHRLVKTSCYLLHLIHYDSEELHIQVPHKCLQEIGKLELVKWIKPQIFTKVMNKTTKHWCNCICDCQFTAHLPNIILQYTCTIVALLASELLCDFAYKSNTERNPIMKWCTFNEHFHIIYLQNASASGIISNHVPQSANDGIVQPFSAALLFTLSYLALTMLLNITAR